MWNQVPSAVVAFSCTPASAFHGAACAVHTVGDVSVVVAVVAAAKSMPRVKVRPADVLLLPVLTTGTCPRPVVSLSPVVVGWSAVSTTKPCPRWLGGGTMTLLSEDENTRVRIVL